MVYCLLVVPLLVLSFVQAAPTSLDASTLLKNGQDAQLLNTAFGDLKVTDSCTSGQIACISGATAQCVNDAWQTKKCVKGLQCFALPSVKTNGTIIQCTSESSALSLISATGAVGGIKSTTNSTGSDDSSANADNESTVSSSATKTASADVSPETVTVTVTLLPQSTFTNVQTRTLNPSEAASFLSSLTADGSFSVVSIIAPSPTAIVSISANGDDDAALSQSVTRSSSVATDSPVPTIFLTPASQTTALVSLPAATSPSSPAITASPMSDHGY